MFYYISLYVSLAIFIAGSIYKIVTWFTRSIGWDPNQFPAAERVSAGIKGIFRTIFSRKIVTLIKVFILDVLLQRKILQQSFIRWIMHIFIFFSFILLLVFHGLGELVSSRVFDVYYPTLNPFMFLRDLFGILLLMGLSIALVRRFVIYILRLSTGVMDTYVLFIIFIIVLSGVVLEGVKITSYSIFTRMVRDYSPAGRDEQMKSLEAYWVKDFGLAAPHIISFDKADMEEGKSIHARSCAGCHSEPIWAFSGFAAASVIKPGAHIWDKHNVWAILLNIHLLACFIALAYLPFSKFLHLFSTPWSLLLNSVMEQGRSSPANMITKRIIELDACTNCGSCTIRCSVLAASLMSKNPYILPSAKIRGAKALASGRKLSWHEFQSLLEGIYVCTNCYRCSVICPSGINLRDMWLHVREQMLHKGYPLPVLLSPLSYYRALRKKDIFADEDNYYTEPVTRARDLLTARLDRIQSGGEEAALSAVGGGFLKELGLSADAATYSHCFTCSACTTSCPVVANYEKPMEHLGLLPHQVIQSAVLGLRDHALGSKMIWDCLTCYKCQERCPQGVRVTEVFYKLKNRAIARARMSLQPQVAEKTA